MENIIPYTMFGTALGFLLVIGLVFITLIISDLNGAGFFATAVIITFLIFNYYFGNFPVLEFITIKNVVVYVFIGFIFSLIRTYFKGQELTTEYQKQNFKLKDHVFRWWFLWPISALNWIFGKLLRDLYNVFYTKVENLYKYLFGLNQKKV